MALLEGVLVTTTVLCSLVAGLLFAFAVVVMPGIGRLPDRAFLRAFQVADGVIQRGQPLFGIAWLGSVVTLGAAIALGVGPRSLRAPLESLERHPDGPGGPDLRAADDPPRAPLRSGAVR